MTTTTVPTTTTARAAANVAAAKAQAAAVREARRAAMGPEAFAEFEAAVEARIALALHTVVCGYFVACPDKPERVRPVFIPTPGGSDCHCALNPAGAAAWGF